MELRKDPITRSWVMTGDDPAESSPRPETACRFCPDAPDATQVISAMPSAGRLVGALHGASRAALSH